MFHPKTIENMIITILVLLATVAMFIIGKIRADIVALCALTILILCGILSPAEALSGFSNPVVVMMVGLFVVGGAIVLIAAMMSMATALEKTGVSSMVSHGLVAALGGIGPMALLCVIYFTTSLLTMFISNTATAVLMAPIALSAATELNVSPLAFLFAVTLGASMCFASPFSTPPNALVMQAGGYTFGDYVKVGLPLQIIMGIVMTIVLPLLFPL